MALFKCPECERKISDKADACPQCGYPVGKQPAQPILQVASPSATPRPVAPSQVSTPPAKVVSPCAFIPDPAAVAAAEDTIKKMTVLKQGKWSEAVGGKLSIDGSRLVSKKRKKEQLVFDLGHVVSLGHKGSKLTVKTKHTHFVILFGEFGAEAQRRKEILAKLMGKPLPPKPAGMPAAKVVKHAAVGVVVAAVVIISIVKSLSNGPSDRVEKEQPISTARAPKEQTEKKQPTSADNSDRSRVMTPEEIAAWKKKQGYPLEPAKKKTAQQSSAGSGGMVGKDTRLFVKGLTSIPVAIDQSALDAYGKFAVARDRYGPQELILSGRIFTVSNGTRARVIERNLATTEVRIMDGPHQGKRGLVPYEWVE